MKFHRFFTAGAVCIAALVASSVQAALHFSQADLLSMTIEDDLTFGFTDSAETGLGMTSNINYGHPGPSALYQDMRGLAGATGNLSALQATNENMATDPIGQALLAEGFTATAFYSLNGVQLAALNAAIASAAPGGSVLEVMGFNDNNSAWTLGIWAGNDGTGESGFDDLLLAAGAGGALSLDLSTITAPLTRAGVFIALNDDGSDNYHASFGVPEPMTFVVWSALGAIGFLAYRRRQIA